jgi:cold shock CspA family protein
LGDDPAAKCKNGSIDPISVDIDGNSPAVIPSMDRIPHQLRSRPKTGISRGLGRKDTVKTRQVRVGPGHKGPHITEIISVDSSAAKPIDTTAIEFGATTSDGSSSGVAVEETGTVKWFNAERGYGFIALDGGGKDVFVHISALERSGLTSLGEGQQVIVDVVEGRKGLEAARVRLI